MIEKFQKGLAKHFCSVNCLRLQQSGGSAGQSQEEKGQQDFCTVWKSRGVRQKNFGENAKTFVFREEGGREERQKIIICFCVLGR